WRGGVVHSGADRAERHPRQRNRLRACAQCRRRPKRCEFSAHFRSNKKSAALRFCRLHFLVSACGCLDAAGDQPRPGAGQKSVRCWWPGSSSRRFGAVLSPWVGYYSERFGRKPLLLIGFGVEALRGLLLAGYTTYPALVIGQCLGGISAAA